MGSNESSSKSEPVSAKEREKTYNYALANLLGRSGSEYDDSKKKGGTDPQFTKTFNELAPSYSTPTYTDAGAAHTLTNGDYEKLQSDVLQGTISGLDRAKLKDTIAYNNSAAKRGIWSGGLALQGENDINETYAPQYAKAGADAAQLRYNLQNSENQGLNAYQQAAAAAKNTFASDQAQKSFEAKWRPADYLMGLWNGTGGTISTGSAGGWSI